MTLMFPPGILSTINSTEVAECNLFVPAWAPVYDCRPIDDFNALLVAEIDILKTRFRFHSEAHGDWVATNVWYRISPAIGNEEEKEGAKDKVYMRPLNSWFLKDPVGLVPCEKDLEAEVVWRRRVAKLCSSECVPNTSLDELHSYYVREACKELCSYERLLREWQRSGEYCDQEDWGFISAAEKKTFREQIKLQRLNALNMKEKFELFRKTGAPEFLITQSAGMTLREKKILERMHDAVSICN